MWRWTDNTQIGLFASLLLLSSLPCFLTGLVEDITKKVGAKERLLATMISAAIAGELLNAWLTNVQVFGVDWVLSIPLLSMIFTCFCIAGVAHSFNLIDGYNGLSGAVATIILIALAYVAFQVRDYPIMICCFAGIGAIIGFLFWNYPKGLIFLGDGGSYLIGFWIASLSILLVARHPTVSPWFALSVNAYPALETLFTIYRRKIHQGRNPDEADGMHFHTLIYRRVLKKQFDIQNPKLTNSRTSPYLWILSGLPVIASMLWWNSTPTLAMCCLLFILGYLWLYQKIVRFKTPRWLRFF